MLPKLPKGFDELRSLRNANVFAVAAALAALTGSAFAALGSRASSAPLIVASTVSTFVVGLVWAAVLRLRRRVTSRKWQLGWVLSAPLAMLNASLAAGLLLGLERGGRPTEQASRFLFGMLAGATYGAVIWIPALIATLLCFGFPLARAQRLAERGLGGAERGERVVGIAAATLGLVAVVAGGLNVEIGDGLRAMLATLGAGAAGAGTLAASWSAKREKRRETFVKSAEAGQVQGYRVETAPEGKVLVRVETGNEAYRAGDRFEAVYELAPDGEARRALVAE